MSGRERVQPRSFVDNLFPRTFFRAQPFQGCFWAFFVSASWSLGGVPDTGEWQVPSAGEFGQLRSKRRSGGLGSGMGKRTQNEEFRPATLVHVVVVDPLRLNDWGSSLGDLVLETPTSGR